ncbi:MAG: quinolinate synthetase [Thermoplasmatales archaeon SG8-52-3]|nr:MAG: quinolinate synthetase [Thermoplasmatales archaeon SG8-52-3]
MNKKNIDKIIQLKKKYNAIILAHNYQLPEVQDIADFLGDSLDLAIKATKTDCDNIVFCGVDFMAQSAKILNPDKNVIHPDIEAECPMANTVNTVELLKLKKDNPDAEVVSYINTTIETKAISDICCTSANGVKVVESLHSKKIIFVPDKNLGNYIQRNAKDKELIIWPGVCPTHHRIRKEEILDLKKIHPDAEILVHPECRPEVIDISDFALSTNGMLNHVKKSDANEFIIGTEKELCYRLKNENNDKIFYPIKTAICPNMKKITFEKVLNSLETLEPKIEIPVELMKKAKIPLKKMMDIGRGD